NSRIAEARRAAGPARIPEGRSRSADPSGTQDDGGGSPRRDRARGIQVRDKPGDAAAAAYSDLSAQSCSVMLKQSHNGDDASSVICFLALRSSITSLPASRRTSSTLRKPSGAWA